MNYQPLNKWAELYVDYVNNFLTIEKWAEHYDMSIEQATDIYTLGRMSDNFSKSITL